MESATHRRVATHSLGNAGLDDDGGSDESGDESDGSYCSTEGHGAKPDVDLFVVSTSS
jgi:hypothetical protein